MPGTRPLDNLRTARLDRIREHKNAVGGAREPRYEPLVGTFTATSERSIRRIRRARDRGRGLAVDADDSRHLDPSGVDGGLPKRGAEVSENNCNDLMPAILERRQSDASIGGALFRGRRRRVHGLGVRFLRSASCRWRSSISACSSRMRCAPANVIPSPISVVMASMRSMSILL